MKVGWLRGYKCRGCGEHLLRRRIIEEMPPLIVLQCMFTPSTEINIESDLDIAHACYRLTGLIYGDGNHFVSRIIDTSGGIWYHDGMSTGNRCIEESSLTLATDLHKLKYANNKSLLYSIYRKI